MQNLFCFDLLVACTVTELWPSQSGSRRAPPLSNTLSPLVQHTHIVHIEYMHACAWPPRKHFRCNALAPAFNALNTPTQNQPTYLYIHMVHEKTGHYCVTLLRHSALWCVPVLNSPHRLAMLIQIQSSGAREYVFDCVRHACSVPGSPRRFFSISFCFNVTVQCDTWFVHYQWHSAGAHHHGSLKHATYSMSDRGFVYDQAARPPDAQEASFCRVFADRESPVRRIYWASVVSQQPNRNTQS